MSGIGDADLVRVRSHNELRAGLTLVARMCRWHRRICTMLILSEERHPTGHHINEVTGQREPCLSHAKWRITDADNRTVCFCASIAEGRLYRLRDLGDADEICRRTICDLDDLKRASQRKRVGFPLAGRAR